MVVFVYLLLYIDDILIATKDVMEIEMVESQLSEKFKTMKMGASVYVDLQGSKELETMFSVEVPSQGI